MMEQIWWNRVPNALAFATDISDHLLQEKSVLLQYASIIPWKSCLFGQIEERVMQQDSSKTFDAIETTENPGEFLLNRYCKTSTRALYRPSKTYAHFLAESDDVVLHNRYIWVNVGTTKMLEAWMDFVSDYCQHRGKGKNSAAFCIVWKGKEKIRPRKGLYVLSFDDYISDYDRVAFTTLAASSIKEVPFIKNYLMELMASLSGNDMELVARCLPHYRELLKDPGACLEKLTRETIRSDGSGFTIKTDEEEVRSSIWLAQIRTIYPLLEEQRRNLVERHKDIISRLLPIPSALGEEYTDYRDVELGAIFFLIKNGRMRLQQSEYEKFKLFREARNRLSHLGILSLEEIKELL